MTNHGVHNRVSDPGHYNINIQCVRTFKCKRLNSYFDILFFVSS